MYISFSGFLIQLYELAAQDYSEGSASTENMEGSADADAPLSVVNSRSRSFSIAVAANVRARGRILCTRARVFSAFPVLYRRRALRTGRPAVVIVFSRSSLSGV